jgi:hypothetical protein
MDQPISVVHTGATPIVPRQLVLKLSGLSSSQALLLAASACSLYDSGLVTEGERPAYCGTMNLQVQTDTAIGRVLEEVNLCKLPEEIRLQLKP